MNRLTLPISLISVFVFFCCSSPVSAQSHMQKLTCSVGYTPAECHKLVLVLREAMRKYPMQDLGDWSWVIQRTSDWRRFLSDRKLAPGIPAFTYLPERETYLDEALMQTESPRGIELSVSWHMPIPDLLDLAIRHEMGHALCKERDEAAARRTAETLRDDPSMSLRACHPKTAAPAPQRAESPFLARRGTPVFDSQLADQDRLSKMNRKSRDLGKPLE